MGLMTIYPTKHISSGVVSSYSGHEAEIDHVDTQQHSHSCFEPLALQTTSRSVQGARRTPCPPYPPSCALDQITVPWSIDVTAQWRSAAKLYCRRVIQVFRREKGAKLGPDLHSPERHSMPSTLGGSRQCTAPHHISQNREVMRRWHMRAQD